MGRFLIRNIPSSIKCNGVNSKISITGVASQLTLSTISLSAWMLVNGVGGGGGGRVFMKGGGGTVGYIDLGMGTGTGHIPILFKVDYSGTDGGWSWAIPYLNRWFHVILTYDYGALANDPVLYINNVLATAVTDQNPTGTIVADSNTISIGNRGSDTARAFDGSLLEIKLFNKILSEDERSDLYFRGITPTGCVGDWRGNEGTGTSIADSSGNSGAGTASNITWSVDVPPFGRDRLTI